MLPFVEVRFLKGENRRFFGAREAAKKRGYPDVPTYLRATGQVDQWCEEVPAEEVEEFEKAQLARQQSLKIGQNYVRRTE